MKNLGQKYWKAIVISLILLGAFGFALYTSTLNTLPQASYGLFSTVAAPTSTGRIMVVSPHQDDETLGAGGYITAARATGAQVEIIFATDGNKHGKKDTRHQEALAAAAKLGVPASQVSFFDRPDGQLGDTAEYSQFVGQLTAAVKAFQPTVIITTLPEDEHSDHAAAGRAVKALGSDVTSAQKWYFLIHADRYPRPIGDKPSAYLLPPLALMAAYDWRVWPINQADQTTKRQAIELYRSQLMITNPVLRQLLFSFDRRNELFAAER